MKYSDNSPQKQVLIRLEYPIFYYIKEEAKHNNMTVTELCRHYLIKGFGKNRFDIILNQARNQGE